MRPYRLFSPDMYRFDTPQPSYWEALASGEPELGTPLAGEASCDVAILVLAIQACLRLCTWHATTGLMLAYLMRAISAGARPVAMPGFAVLAEHRSTSVRR